MLEDLSGLGAKQLRNLSADGTIPARVGRAEYPCAETLRRLIAYYRRKADAGSSDPEIERKLDLERLRKLRIANAKAAREVINVEDAKKAHGELLMTFVQRVDDLPSKLSAALENRPAEYILVQLKAEMHSLRELLAKTPDYRFDTDLEEEDAEDEDA